MARLLVAVKSHGNPATRWPGHPWWMFTSSVVVKDSSELQASHWERGEAWKRNQKIDQLLRRLLVGGGLSSWFCGDVG